MSTKQETDRLHGWTSESIDLKRVFLNFSNEASDELKYFLQNSSSPGVLEEIEIFPPDFPKLNHELNNCRKEVDCGQRFVILEGFEGISYRDIQKYFWIVSNLLGTPLKQDKFGRRLIHIYDRDSTKQIKDGARYHQTHESGAIHTDNVNIPEPWDYLLVGCVAPAMIGGENIIVCGFSVHNHLEKKAPEDLAVLRENFWWEFRGISNELYSAPILTYDDAGQPLFRYLRTYLESAHIKADQPLTPQQRRAMDALDATLSMSEFQIKHRLQAGQILVANDNQIFHDRECFVDFPDSVSVEEKGAGKNGILRRTLERTWIKKPQI